VRTAYTSWSAHENDLVVQSGAHAVARHLARTIRQATRVVAISAPSDNSGSLTVESATGDNLVWDHDGSSDCVNFGVGTASDLFAENITALTFVGYDADATTATTDPNEIQIVKCSVSVTLPTGTKTVTAWGWLRSW